MITKAVLARFESRSGQDEAIQRFMSDPREFSGSQSAAAIWFGLRYGRGDYGTFNGLPDEAACQAHLDGGLVRPLMDAQQTVLSGAPTIQRMDVLAFKLPNAGELTIFADRPAARERRVRAAGLGCTTSGITPGPGLFRARLFDRG